MFCLSRLSINVIKREEVQIEPNIFSMLKKKQNKERIEKLNYLVHDKRHKKKTRQKMGGVAARPRCLEQNFSDNSSTTCVESGENME